MDLLVVTRRIIFFRVMQYVVISQGRRLSTFPDQHKTSTKIFIFHIQKKWKTFYFFSEIDISGCHLFFIFLLKYFYFYGTKHYRNVTYVTFPRHCFWKFENLSRIKKMPTCFPNKTIIFFATPLPKNMLFLLPKKRTLHVIIISSPSQLNVFKCCYIGGNVWILF